jgi:hypothetical protein
MSEVKQTTGANLIWLENTGLEKCMPGWRGGGISNTSKWVLQRAHEENLCSGTDYIFQACLLCTIVSLRLLVLQEMRRLLITSLSLPQSGL